MRLWLFVVEEKKLVFSDVQLRWDFVLVGADKAGDAAFDQFDGGSAAGFAVVSEGLVLSPGEFESDRVILIASTRPFVFTCVSHGDRAWLMMPEDVVTAEDQLGKTFGLGG